MKRKRNVIRGVSHARTNERTDDSALLSARQRRIREDRRRRSVPLGTPGTGRERERAKRTLSAQTATLTEAVSAREARRGKARRGVARSGAARRDEANVRASRLARAEGFHSLSAPVSKPISFSIRTTFSKRASPRS